MKQIVIKICGTLLIAAMGFYLGCLAYRVVTHGLYYVSALTLIVLHIFGIDLAVLQVPVFAFDIARGNEAAMYGAGFIAFCCFAVFTPGQLEFPRKKTRGVVLLTTVSVLFVAGVVADFYYGITPLSEISLSEPAYNAKRAPVEHRFSVENVMHLQDRLSGVTAEVDGVLDYDRRMKRFILRSTVQKGQYVKVFFFQRRRTLFSDMRMDGMPRYHATVEPFIGRHVRILGKCVNGQIDADVADVREITESRIDPNDSRPLAPL